MPEAPVVAQAEPATLEEAQRWITSLQDAFHREAAYVKRLEAQIHREHTVVEIAQYWHKARGMHRAPWLNRLRDALVELKDRERREVPLYDGTPVRDETERDC